MCVVCAHVHARELAHTNSYKLTCTQRFTHTHTTYNYHTSIAHRHINNAHIYIHKLSPIPIYILYYQLCCFLRAINMSANVASVNIFMRLYVHARMHKSTPVHLYPRSCIHAHIHPHTRIHTLHKHMHTFSHTYIQYKHTHVCSSKTHYC